MSPLELRALTTARPFVPFTLLVTDGTSYKITHPEQLVPGIRMSYVVIPSAEQPDLADRLVRLDNLHITQTIEEQVRAG
jgi:hypothetical protein